MPSRILYQTDTACVEYFSTANANLAFVFSSKPGGDLSGNTDEGARLLHNGFDVIAFKIIGHDWFQAFPEALLKAVDSQLDKKPYLKRVAYGTAAGGYPAMAFSRWLNPETTMLVSPQYHADARFAISQTCQFFVFFDNKSNDSVPPEQWLHLIPADNARLIKLPYSGQPSSHFLIEAGLLAQLELKVLAQASCAGIDFSGTKGRSVAYLFNLGTALLGRNKPLTALAVSQKALAINDRIWSFHFRKGEILARFDRHHDAIHAMQAAIALEPDNPELHYHLSTSLLHLGLLVEALQASSRVIELEPDRPGFWGYHSNLLWRNGKPEESLAAILRAIELDPANASYHAHKSGMLQALERLDEAIQAASSAVALAPDNQAMQAHHHALLAKRQLRSQPLPLLQQFTNLDQLLAPWR
jgi:hypothetical protein